jgi:translocon-associated protein subunit gamma
MVEKKSKDSSGFTKEEELLLQDFSRNVSTKSNALFYVNAFFVSVIPICKYFVVDLMGNGETLQEYWRL